MTATDSERPFTKEGLMRIRKPNLKAIPEDLRSDFVILDGGTIWHASKNRYYRESVTNNLTSIHQFLRAKRMYAFNQGELINPETFQVRRDALTESGFLFVWRYLDGYLGQLERTGRISNLDYLEACFDHFSGDH